MFRKTDPNKEKTAKYFAMKRAIAKNTRLAKVKEEAFAIMGKECAFQTEGYRAYQKEYKRKRREAGIKQPTYGTPEYRQQYRKLYHAYHRDRVFELLGGAVCAECGCTVRENLELNHIAGGGAKDTKKLLKKNITAVRRFKFIIENPEELAKYNVLCRVCNAHHYLRDVKKVKGGNYKVVFTPDPLTSDPTVLN